jgi:recombinational DNA repair ATPase RecF
MKILSLMMENVLKIRAIGITPKSEVVEIKGENAMGKSSILEAIVIAFKGDRDLPKQPIKKGAKKGIVKISLDGDPAANIPPFTVTKKITEKGTSLKIEPDSVYAGETPRSFLDKLIGKISFDPLAFINEEGKKQRRVLLDLIGIDVDSLDTEEKNYFDLRTSKGREVKVQQAKIKGFNVWREVKNTKELSVSELSQQLTEAINFNNSINNRQTANASLGKLAIRIRDEYIPSKEEKISSLEEELRIERDALKKMKDELEDKRKEFNAEKALLLELKAKDISTFNQLISDAEKINSKIRDNKKYDDELIVLHSLESEYEKLDMKIETVRRKRIDLLSAAKMPVDGLSFDEDGLLYNDIPLSQCSDGEKLMVSMGISMALNPMIRVLRIKDGSLLGPKNMAILRKMVKDNDFQLWIERVESKEQYDASGGIGIFIDEGEMVEEDGSIVTDIFGHGSEQPHGVVTPGADAKSGVFDKDNLPDDDF